MMDWWTRGQPPVKGEGEVDEGTLSPAVRATLNALGEAVTQLRAVAESQHAALQGSLLLSAPGLAIGTQSKADIAYEELLWQVDGVRYRLPAGEVSFTATTHDIADPDDDPREAIYVLSVAAGAEDVTITKSDTAAEGEAVAPDTPEGHVKLGEVLIQHDGSDEFDATTDDLDAAHLAVSFSDEAPFTLEALPWVE